MTWLRQIPGVREIVDADGETLPRSNGMAAGAGILATYDVATRRNVLSVDPAFARSIANPTARLAATGNIANLANAGLSQDGATVVNGDRILLPLQTDPTENGVYVGTIVGEGLSLARAADMAAASSVLSGVTVAVQAGDAWQGSTWTLLGDGALTVGTDALSFVNDFIANELRRFGAAGNGTTDDTAAVQSAIDAAKATTRRVVLPPGTYRITDTLTIPQGIAFEGVNKPSTTGTPSTKILWDPPAPSATQACILYDCSDSVLAGGRIANLLIFQGSSVAATGAGYGIHVKQSAAGYKPSWLLIHDCLIDAFDADPWTKGIYVEGTEATAGDRPRDIYIDRVRITGTAAEDGGDWLLGGAGIHLYRAANVSIKDTLCNNNSRLLIDAPTDEDYTSSIWVTNCMIGSLDLGFAKDVYVRGGRFNDIRCDANSTSNVLEPDFVSALTLPLGGSANLLRVPEWASAAWVSNFARYIVKTDGSTTPLEQVAAEIVKFGSAGDLRFTFGTVPTIGTSNPGDVVFPQGGGVWGVNAAADGTVRIGLVGGDNNVYSGNEGAGSLVAGKYIYLAGTTNGPKLMYCSGSPESALTGNVGDICIRTDGAAGTSVYYKETGTGNTGWVARSVFNCPIKYGSVVPVYTAENAITTNGASATTALTYTVADAEAVVHVVAVINCKKTSTGDVAVYKRAASFKAVGGTVTQVGTTDVLSDHVDAALATCVATIDNSGDDVRVRVTGIGATDLVWSVTAQVTHDPI